MNYSNYLSILNSGTYRQRIKVELLRPSDESPYGVVDTYLENSSGSSLNISWQNGVRRTCSIALINLSDSPYYIDPDSLYINSKFKLHLGLEDGIGNIEWFACGVFLMDDPQLTSQFSQSILTLKGIDKFGAYSSIRGELDGTYQIPLNTDISVSIKSILTDLVNDPKAPIIDVSLVGKTNPYTIVKEIGSKIGDVLLELSSINSNNIYYNTEGQLVIEPDFDFSTQSSQFDFTTEQFQYLGNTTLTYKFSELYNSVLVISSNTNDITYSYRAQNNNLLSPVSIPNLGFERCFVYRTDILNSVVQCMDLANYILLRKTIMQSEISFSSIPLYHLSVGDVITLTDSNLKLNKKRYIISSISLPLQVGSQMTINCVETQELILN